MLKKICFFLMLACGSARSLAAELSIIDVRRNIPLSDEESVYKDFYISAGEGSGLKKNLVVTAVRKISIRDASGAQAFGEIMVPVGQLRILAVYGKIAVAREYKLLSRDELPMLEQTGIMSGDSIDLQGSFIDNSKPKSKRKVAAEMPAAPLVQITAELTTPPAVTAVAPATAPTTPPAVNSAEVAAPATAAAAPVAAPAPANPQKLEKTADSGNNTTL